MRTRLLVFHPHFSTRVSSGLGRAEVRQPDTLTRSLLRAVPSPGVGQAQAGMEGDKDLSGCTPLGAEAQVNPGRFSSLSRPRGQGV